MRVIKNNLPAFISLLIIGAISLPVFFFGSFGDEQENFVAGWYIVHNLIPYQDFFFHHAPLPFFVAAGPMAITTNLTVQRLWLFIFYMAGWTALFKFLGKQMWLQILAVAIIISLALPIIHGQMLLAESIVSYCAVLFALLAYGSWKYHTPNLIKLFALYLAVTFISVWSTIASLPMWLLIGLLLVYTLVKSKKVEYIVRPTLWFIILNSVFLLYFAINNALSQAWWSIFTYNNQYYYPDRLADGELEQRYGMLFRIVHQFWLWLFDAILSLTKAIITVCISILYSYKELLIHYQGIFDYFAIIFHEFTQHLLATDISILLIFLTACLLLGFQYRLKALLLLPILIFARFRSNELFHQAIFINLLIAVNMILMIDVWRKHKIIAITAAILCLPFLSNLLLNYHQHLSRHQPIVTSYQQSAANTIKEYPTDSFVLLGGETVLYLLTNDLPISSSHYYHPWFVNSAKIRDPLLNSISQHATPLIVMEYIQNEEFYDRSMFNLLSNEYILSGNDSHFQYFVPKERGK